MKESAEAWRRKIFIKAAHDLMKEWPGFGLPLPPPRHKTDEFWDEELMVSLSWLKIVWTADRSGLFTAEEFEKAVKDWRVTRSTAVSQLRVKFKENKHK